MSLFVHIGLISHTLSILIYVIHKEDTGFMDQQQKFIYKKGTRTLEMKTCDNLRSVSGFHHDEGKTNNELLPMKQDLETCEAEPLRISRGTMKRILEEFKC